MFESIKNLEEICRRCLSSEPLTLEQAKWLGKSLDDFLNHRCTSLRDAFGLRTPRGGVPWWLEQAMRVRDAALRELAETLGTDGTLTSRAREIRGPKRFKNCTTETDSPQVRRASDAALP